MKGKHNHIIFLLLVRTAKIPFFVFTLF